VVYVCKYKITKILEDLCFSHFTNILPKGSEENQVAPFRVRGKQIDFLNDMILLGIKADTHLINI
jgi:hypothetical protein